MVAAMVVKQLVFGSAVDHQQNGSWYLPMITQWCIAALYHRHNCQCQTRSLEEGISLIVVPRMTIVDPLRNLLPNIKQRESDIEVALYMSSVSELV